MNKLQFSPIKSNVFFDFDLQLFYLVFLKKIISQIVHFEYNIDKYNLQIKVI